MSKVKFDFLNWQPDIQDVANGGLSVANNIIHSESGWVTARLTTTTGFSTATPLTGMVTTTALKAKAFGPSDTLAVALVNKDTVTTSAFAIGVNGSAPFTQTTLATMASIGGAFIRSFSVAEEGQDVVIAAVCEASLLAGGSTFYALGGTFTYTVTSV